jgi:hypothetical protein
LPGFFRDVDPSCVAVACNTDTDDRMEAVLVNSVIAVANDGVVDLPGDDQSEWSCGGPERFLDARSVEQAEGDIQCLAEASVGVVVDFSSVHDDADA